MRYKAINSNRLSLKLIWISDLGQHGWNACSRRACATTTTNLVAMALGDDDWLFLRRLQVRQDVVVDAAASALTARDHNTWAARAPQGRTPDTGADRRLPHSCRVSTPSPRDFNESILVRFWCAIFVTEMIAWYGPPPPWCRWGPSSTPQAIRACRGP